MAQARLYANERFESVLNCRAALRQAAKFAYIERGLEARTNGVPVMLERIDTMREATKLFIAADECEKE